MSSEDVAPPAEELEMDEAAPPPAEPTPEPEPTPVARKESIRSADVPAPMKSEPTKSELKVSISTQEADQPADTAETAKPLEAEQKAAVDRRKSIDNAKRQSLHRDMAATESRKSVISVGKLADKESSKDIFARRKSTRSIKNAVGSIISFRRGSIAEYFDRQKTAKFMNTYKLDSEKPFNVETVQNIIKEILIEALENLTYDAEKIPKQAKWASSAIRAKVKEQEYDRYKIVCVVTIGEKRSQDMYSTYRFLWDAERDKHASYVHENMSVFAIGLCFGLYYE